MPIMNSLRHTLREKRRAISATDRESFAEALLVQIQKIAEFQSGQKIAIYLPNDGEIDTKYLEVFLKKQAYDVYLPILDGKSLKFAEVGKNFKKNQFGIDEPVSTQILKAEQLDIIFMPLVGFDQNKNRIGMGGGFYDRTLAFKQQQSSNAPKLYGLAFDCQKTEKLDVKDWDVPLDAIITPSSIYQ